MAVYAPGDTPFTGNPGAGMDPGMWARLMGYAFPPAQAAEAPDPNSDAARQAALAAAAAQLNNRTPASPSPVDAASAMPVTAAQVGGGNIPIGGGPGMTMESPSSPPWFLRGGNTPTMAIPSVLPGQAVAGGGGSGAAPAAIDPRARAQVPAAAAAAAADPRFASMQYGTAQRGPGSTPYITALNLGGLFGGGAPAAANPANVPSAAATPMSGGALAKGSTMAKAPWDYGPTQKGKVFPGEMGPFTPAQRAARSLKQRYG